MKKILVLSEELEHLFPIEGIEMVLVNRNKFKEIVSNGLIIYDAVMINPVVYYFKRENKEVTDKEVKEELHDLLKRCKEKFVTIVADGPLSKRQLEYDFQILENEHYDFLVDKSLSSSDQSNIINLGIEMFKKIKT